MVAVAGMGGSVRVLGDTVRIVGDAFDDYGPGFGEALTITADGTRVLHFDGHRWLLRLWDVRTGELLGGMNRLSRRFAFSPGGRHALALTEEETVLRVDLATAAVHELGSAAAWGGGLLAVTDDDRVALCSSWQFGLQRWLLDDNRCVFTGVSDLGADVSVSADGRVALLSIPGGESVGVLWPPEPGPAAPWSYARPGSAARLIEDARTAEAVMDRAAALLDGARHAEAWDRLRMVRALPGYRRHPRLLPLWRRVGASTARSGFAGAWRTRTFERLVRGQAAITPDARRAIVGRYDGSVAVFDLMTGRATEAAEGHGCEIWSSVVCADGRHALTRSARGVHMVWELATARRVATVIVPDDGPVRLRQDGDSLVLRGEEDGPSFLWDRTGRRPLFAWPGGSVHTVALSGDVAATPTRDGGARVLDVRDGRLLRTARFRMAEGSGAIQAVASSDGCVVVAAQQFHPSGRGVIQLSSPELPNVGYQQASRDFVNCLALTPDGRLL
ncbi:hypothetical protein GCM10018793_70250 [Streptomyces sulfonofaciens]|uniref:WD40 repeat domain-containing protein n=1 Tax=Streptomyces sulfonofaciens TaxID=68272 RepID=A0A919GQ44_9ACTN|nr:hypothetical protein GCM10018793_70250 [Streptomyces sulfonofaciens]